MGLGCGTLDAYDVWDADADLNDRARADLDFGEEPGQVSLPPMWACMHEWEDYELSCDDFDHGDHRCGPWHSYWYGVMADLFAA